MIEINIIREGIAYKPMLEGKMTWVTERQGAPGKLTFSVVKDEIINFQEGNTVNLYVDDKPVFHGYIFTKTRGKGNTISVTAYDQLRYLKNKDTYVYTKKKASEVVSMVCKDFKLQTGTLVDTGFVIPKKSEDNKTLFEIIQNAIDDTLTNTKRLFVLYDNFGKITLKDVESLQINFGVGVNNAGDFDYSTSIDSQTYNRIKLYYDNEDTGKREIYQTHSTYGMNNWGVLQHYESLKNPVNGKAKAEALLEMYNRKTRQLNIKNILGDIRVRAGYSVMVSLELGDINVNNRFLVEKATHNIINDQHLMDLTLRGSDCLV